MTAVTPSWNALCERIHRLFVAQPRTPASQLTNPVLPTAPVSPPAPMLPTALVKLSSFFKGESSGGVVSAKGKPLPPHGFRNNNMRCQDISKAVAILSLAPDLSIPSDDQDKGLDDQDKGLIDYQATLKNTQEKLSELEQQRQEMLNQELEADECFNKAKTELCGEFGFEEGASNKYEDLVQRATEAVNDLERLIKNSSNKLEKSARKGRKTKLEKTLNLLKQAHTDLEKGNISAEQICNKIAEKRNEIDTAKENVQKRKQSLERARRAVEIWQKGSTHNLGWEDATAITNCHPARKILDGRKPLFSCETAGEAERDEEGNIVLLKEKLQNQKESAAILYGGGAHWRVFIRLSDGRFALFNDSSDVETWTQRKILKTWSAKPTDPDEPTSHIWYQSQLTFIPEWTAIDASQEEGIDLT